SKGIRLLRELWNDTHAGHSLRHFGGGGPAGLERQARQRGGRQVGRPGGRERRSAKGHHGTAAREVCDEGRRGLQERGEITRGLTQQRLHHSRLGCVIPKVARRSLYGN